MAESFPNGKKTLWEKENLLVTSNFSFSHSVFKRLVSQGRQKVSLCGNGLKYSAQTPFGLEQLLSVISFIEKKNSLITFTGGRTDRGIKSRSHGLFKLQGGDRTEDIPSLAEFQRRQRNIYVSKYSNQVCRCTTENNVLS